MGQEARATPLIRDTAPVIHTGSLTDKVKQMFDSVAERAFAIFQSNRGSRRKGRREIQHSPAHSRLRGGDDDENRQRVATRCSG